MKIFECLLCLSPCHSHWPLCTTCSRNWGSTLHNRGSPFEAIDDVPLVSFGIYRDAHAKLLKTAKSQPFGLLGERLQSVLSPLVEHWAEELKSFSFEAIACVPSHPWRAFWQTDLSHYLGESLSRVLKRPLIHNLIRFRGASLFHLADYQKNLGRRERLDPQRRYRFLVHQSGFQRLLLVDDIATTGATLKACIHLLQRRGFQIEACATFAQAECTPHISSDKLGV